MAAKKKKPARKGSSTTLIANKSRIRTDVPLLNQPDDIDAEQFMIDGQEVTADQVDLTDPNFDFNKLTANKLTADTLANRFMTAADYTLVDPSEIQAEYGDITRGEMRKNSKLSSELALEALDTELQGLQNYAPTAANLQRQEIAKDNTFNTAERLRSLEAADPNIRKDLEGQAGRARAYAEGRVPDSITDRQLELGVQSRAADRAASGGFGAGSSAAAKAGQLMSAEQRIGLSQYGDQLLSSNVANRTSTLLAPTAYATGGSQIQVTPQTNAGQAAMAIASEANSGMITARDALASNTQQQQFKTGLEQDTRKTNVALEAERDSNQAQLNLQADTTSEANRLAAETTNADNSIRTQLAGKELNSRERQFNAELKTNTATANANRTFEAANANAGRKLEVATTNRAVKLEVEKTNKTLVFQDQQRQKSEAFSARQAAAANAAANARAAMAASSQAAAIAAQKEEAQADRNFQLQQQQQALDIYNQNRDKAQQSSDSAAVGTMITRIPAIISGIAGAYDTISNLFQNNNQTTLGTSGGVEGSGDFSFDNEGNFNVPSFEYTPDTMSSVQAY